jgi:cobalt-zinc-cadmium efflux system membrane fusion protein
MTVSLHRPRCSTTHAGLALALLVGPALAGCHEAAAAYAPPPSEAVLTDEQVKTAKVTVEVASEKDLDATLATTGRVSFEDIKVGHIYSPVNGRVARIDVQLGERVKKGQTLAVIESPDIGQASSDVSKANADLIAAEHNLQREKEMLATHATSYKDYEAAEDAYRQAKAEKQRAMQKAYLLRTAGSDGVSQGFALASPVDGDVLMRNLSPGTEVQGQYSIGGAVQELFTVGELDEVWVLSDIYESDIARVTVGAHAAVAAVAYPNRKFEGKVDWISGTLDPATRTEKVRCTFANPDRLLKQDMYTTVTISVASRKALALPRSAVLHMGDQNVVFIDRGKSPEGKERFERVPILVDDIMGNQWLPVLHGLNAGERVVTTGGEALNAYL